MDSITKKQILSDINSIDVESLLEFISSNDISLFEMLENGLSNAKKKSIEDYFENLATEQAKGQDKQEILNDINNGFYTSSQIQNLLNRGDISEGDLINGTSLTKELITRIKKYQKRETPFHTWKDLPELLPDRTDLFFFGQPGSGKSCILASLFLYANSKNLIIENTHNATGTRYKNQLIEELRYGILPHSTIADVQKGVNYIPFELLDSEDRIHPLTFIEMSGELLNRAYEDGEITEANLAARSILKSKNKKILFFVIDYYRHKQSDDFSMEASQASVLLTILDLLDREGTLASTDGLYIIISKSDLFPSHENKLDHGEDFLWRHYGSFLQNCLRKQEKYHNRFQTVFFPYSIGNVELKDLLTSIDTECPKNIFHAINVHAHYKNESSFWSFFK